VTVSALMSDGAIAFVLPAVASVAGQR
jgi:hypothetical protein